MKIIITISFDYHQIIETYPEYTEGDRGDTQRPPLSNPPWSNCNYTMVYNRLNTSLWFDYHEIIEMYPKCDTSGTFTGRSGRHPPAATVRSAQIQLQLSGAIQTPLFFPSYFFLSSLSLQWLSLLLLLDKPIVISNVSWCRRRKFNIHARANNSARCN